MIVKCSNTSQDAEQSNVTIVYHIKRTKAIGQVKKLQTENTELYFLLKRLNKSGSIIDLQYLYIQPQISKK